MKKCLHCGYLNEDESKICENCKGSLEEVNETESQSETNSKRKEDSSNFSLAIFLSICTVLFLLLFAVSASESYNANKKLSIKDSELLELEGQLQSVQDEYDTYKESIEKYGDIFQYADEIKDYGKLKSEIEDLENRKKEMETSVEDLSAQYENLKNEIELAKNPKPSSDCLLYSDDKVEIYFSGITKDGVVFEVKNLTDINLTFQADSVAINGMSTNSIIMSDDVAPQSVGKIIARCSDFKGTQNIYSVSGQLRVIDFSHDGWDTYDAKFTNVEIK